MAKKIIKISVWSDTENFVNPKPFAEFLAFWKDKLSLIPSEFQDTAEITTWVDEDYAGDKHIAWDVSYLRLETDEEYSCRLEREQERESITRERELNLLKSLKVKYGEGL